MTPQQYYQQDLLKEGFVADPAQANAIEHLQQLYDQLISQQLASRQKKPIIAWVSKVTRFKKAKPQPIRGLYFWGGVGRGKTYLMDAFFQCLPFENKLRLHFHRLMRRIHIELETLKGQQNPLDKVADNLAKEASILCLDEFFVTDIGDALILGTLLKALFDRGVTLVTTSNIEPKYLYSNGLQRQRFLPAIALLEQHTEVIHLDSGNDYRLRALKKMQLYYSGEQQHEHLQRNFMQLVQHSEAIGEPAVLTIENRPLQVLKLTEDVVWFDFDQLCDGPRSQNDYIELAHLFHTVIISDVPQFNKMDDIARRFINLVDEFYDRRVKMILSAAVPLEQLYLAGRLEFEFERTRSRLLEMQSEEFLQLERR